VDEFGQAWRLRLRSFLFSGFKQQFLEVVTVLERFEIIVVLGVIDLDCPPKEPSAAGEAQLREGACAYSLFEFSAAAEASAHLPSRAANSPARAAGALIKEF